MCLIVVAWQSHPAYPLVVAANRDEYHHRLTVPAGWWPDAPHVLGGRDLEAGGTWLGVTLSGRFAALTNVREPGRHRDDAPSRGDLVAGFLTGHEPPLASLDRVVERAAAMNGFNLLVGDPSSLAYLSNRGGPPRVLPAGVFAVSNHALDTPWPKVVQAKSRLREAMSAPALDPERLLALLDDRQPAPDEELPDTGVGLELERLLSAPFVVSPRYGTRSSTVVLVARSAEVTFVERSFDPAGGVTGSVEQLFRLG